MGVRVHINPNTLKQGYREREVEEVLIKRALLFDNTCEHCGDNPTPMVLQVTFSGLTACCWTPGVKSYKAFIANINGIDFTLPWKSGIACAWYYREDGSFGYDRQYANTDCTGAITDYSITTLQITVTAAANIVTVKLNLTSSILSGDRWAAQNITPESGYCTKITDEGPTYELTLCDGTVSIIELE